MSAGSGRLAGKVAIVTGGASGIGAATVRRFREEGAEVVLADVQVDMGSKVATDAGAIFQQLDVASEAQWVALMALVERRFGRLDIVFNNAGVLGNGKSIENIDAATWARVIDINQTGVMLGCQQGIALMRRNPGGSSGSIINTASTTSYDGLAEDIAYSTTKAAVRILTKSVAVWCARYKTNIRCNSIHPGPIDTAIFSQAMPTGADMAPVYQILNAMTPSGRMGKPEEVAALVTFLASDEASYITGSEVLVDGGLMALHPGP